MSHQTNDQVKNLVQIRKSLKRGKAGSLSTNQAFMDFLAIQKQVTTEIDATWAIIREQMETYDVKQLKGDWGSIGFTKPIDSFKIDGKVDSKFTKPVLDTDKIKAYMQLNDKLPKNVINLPYIRFYKKISLA